MRTEELTIAEALTRGRTLPYALLRCCGSFTLGPTPEELSTEELIEARFFDDTTEVRLLRRNGALTGVLLQRTPEDVVIEETRRIQNQRLGRKILLRRFLDWDEDGQTYVRAVCLAGWEGGKADG